MINTTIKWSIGFTILMLFVVGYFILSPVQTSTVHVSPNVIKHAKNNRIPDKYSQHIMRANSNTDIDFQIKYNIAYKNKQRQLANQSEFNNNSQWQTIGPNNVGGRTRTLIFDPIDTDIMYTAGISGGIWKSINGGETWQPIADNLSNISVSTLALLATDNTVIYAGTGEGVYVGRRFTNSVGFAGNGIFVSQDAGESWQQLSTTANNNDFKYTNKIRVGKNNRLHVVTNSGIWHSNDLGQTWVNTLNKADVLGGCLELEISPASGEDDRLLASCGNFEEGGAVYLSMDSGLTWHPVIQAEFQGRTTIKFAPSNPNVVYALSASTRNAEIPHALNTFYRSDDAGETWHEVVTQDNNDLLSKYLLSNPGTINCNDLDNSYIYGQGWYDNALAVDPLDENTVWVGAVEIMRSKDGGKSWEQTAFYYEGSAHPHVDHHGLYFHPNYDGEEYKRLFSVNDGGIAYTDSPDKEGRALCRDNEIGVNWQPLNNNYNVTQFYHGDVSNDGNYIIGGSQDNSTLLLSPDGNWQTVLGGDGGYAFFYSSSRFLASSQIGNVAYIEDNNRRYLEGNTDQSLFITPYLIDPNKENRIWLGGHGLWRMEDVAKDNFTRASKPFTDQYREGITALTVKPDDSDHIIFSQSNGKLSSITNALSSNGETIANDITFSEGAYIRHLSHSIHNKNSVFAVVSSFGYQHIWKSDDSGANWYSIDGVGDDAFPDLPAHTLIELNENSNELYVGTDFGVYVTKNNGTSWLPFVNGLPNVAVYKLVLKRINYKNILYAFTYGRGVFKIDLDIENKSPEWIDEPLKIDTQKGQSISYDLFNFIEDINKDDFTLSSSNLPTGLSLNSNGVLNGSFNEPGNGIITLLANDGDLNSNLDVEFTVSDTQSPSTTGSSSGGGGISIMLLLIIMMFIPRRLLIIRTRG